MFSFRITQHGVHTSSTFFITAVGDTSHSWHRRLQQLTCYPHFCKSLRNTAKLSACEVPGFTYSTKVVLCKNMLRSTVCRPTDLQTYVRVGVCDRACALVCVFFSLSEWIFPYIPLTNTTQEDEDYWPPYGSTIAFTVSKSREAEAGDTERLVMDISIDGEPLRSRLFRGKGDDDGAGAVSLSDFRTAVRNLLPPPPP